MNNRLETMPELIKEIDPRILNNEFANNLLRRTVSTQKEPRKYILSQDVSKGVTGSKVGSEGIPYELVRLIGVNSDMQKQNHYFLSLNGSEYVPLTDGLLDRIKNYNEGTIRNPYKS